MILSCEGTVFLFLGGKMSIIDTVGLKPGFPKCGICATDRKHHNFDSY